MQYAPLFMAVGAAYWVFKSRAIFSIQFFHVRVEAGDYATAISRLHRVHFGISKLRAMHHEALILSFAGQLTDAESLLRTAIAMLASQTSYPRERLYSSLGHVLTSMGRYDEAEEWLDRAIGVGDKTGNSQHGLAELRLEQGRPEEALAFARQAIVTRQLVREIPASYYLDQARALALLGRTEEARESLEAARKTGSKHWAPIRSDAAFRTGVVLRLVGQETEAVEVFQTGYAADQNGMQGRRCLAELRANNSGPQSA